MPEKEKILKEEHQEEKGAAYTPYYLDLGTFEEDYSGNYAKNQEGKKANPFKWKVIEEYDNFEDAYKGYKAYAQKQMDYDREQLEKIWANGRIDIRLRHGPKALNWSGMYTRESDPDEEDAKQIKGKDPIEAQEEDSKIKLDDAKAIEEVFVNDGINDIKDELYDTLRAKLDQVILDIRTTGADATVEDFDLEDLKVKIIYSREFFYTTFKIYIIVSGSKRAHVVAYRALRNEFAKEFRFNEYLIKAQIVDMQDVERSLGYNLKDRSDKIAVRIRLDGHADMNGNRQQNSKSTTTKSYEEINAEALRALKEKCTDLNNLGINKLKERAKDSLSKYDGPIKDKLREEFGKGLDAINKIIDLREKDVNAMNTFKDEIEALLERARVAFSRVVVLSEVTAELRPGEPAVGSELTNSEKTVDPKEDDKLLRLYREISNEVRGTHASKGVRELSEKERAAFNEEFGGKKFFEKSHETSKDINEKLPLLDDMTREAINGYLGASNGKYRTVTIDNPTDLRMHSVNDKWESTGGKAYGDKVVVVYNSDEFKGITDDNNDLLSIPAELSNKLKARLHYHPDEWFFLRVENSKITNKPVLKPTVFSILNMKDRRFEAGSGGGNTEYRPSKKKEPTSSYKPTPEQLAKTKQKEAEEYERNNQHPGGRYSTTFGSRFKDPEGAKGPLERLKKQSEELKKAEELRKKGQ